MERFEAQWIAKQNEVDGEWDPALDEYGVSYHDTLEEAEQAAMEGAKAGGVEWWRITFQVWDPTYYGPHAGGWRDEYHRNEAGEQWNAEDE